jgi:hypothetical protein
MIMQTTTNGQLLVAAFLALVAGLAVSSSSRSPVEITGTRFENEFQINETRGLVVSVRINQLQGKPTSDDFRLVFTDENGQPGDLASLAMGFPDAAEPEQSWVLLTDRTGTIETEGRFEFVFLIGPSVREASLHYRQQAVGSFTIPW